LIAQAQDALETEEAKRGRRVVLVLDESHLLSSEQLEQLRMLTNSQMDSRATFACLLLGQPTLRKRARSVTSARWCTSTNRTSHQTDSPSTNKAAYGWPCGEAQLSTSTDRMAR
jgi:type II secretory pathway predicted ATPase ExeA